MYGQDPSWIEIKIQGHRSRSRIAAKYILLSRHRQRASAVRRAARPRPTEAAESSGVSVATRLVEDDFLVFAAVDCCFSVSEVNIIGRSPDSAYSTPVRDNSTDEKSTAGMRCIGCVRSRLLGPFHGAIAVPSVTRCRCRRRCRCRGHRCAGGGRQYR